MKIGDLVLCTAKVSKKRRIGVIKRKLDGIIEAYVVFFFDPPNDNWNDSIWTKDAMELL